MIIGIAGKMNVGKDVVSGIIQDITRDRMWHIKKFADPIKEMVCILLGCTREQLEDREYKETELSEEWWYVALEDYDNTKRLISLQEYYDYIEGTTYIPKKKDIIKLTPRKLMQLLGTECGRTIIHPNIWINAVMSKYKADENPNWIITDVRFPNELLAIKERKGIIINVIRPNNPATDDHVSETALNKATFDHIIINDGTIMDLSDKVEYILMQENIIT